MDTDPEPREDNAFDEEEPEEGWVLDPSDGEFYLEYSDRQERLFRSLQSLAKPIPLPSLVQHYGYVTIRDEELWPEVSEMTDEPQKPMGVSELSDIRYCSWPRRGIEAIAIPNEDWSGIETLITYHPDSGNEGVRPDIIWREPALRVKSRHERVTVIPLDALFWSLGITRQDCNEIFDEWEETLGGISEENGD